MNLTALQKIPYGMFVVSTAFNGKMNGQIANTVLQISAEPPTIAVSINKQNLTHELITASGVFSVSILSEKTPLAFIGAFGFKAGRTNDKFKDINFETGETGTPIVLDYAVGYLEAKVITAVDVITHTLFIGTLVAAEVREDAPPMTYDYYHRIKGGLTQKNAPTYIKK